MLVTAYINSRSKVLDIFTKSRRRSVSVQTVENSFCQIVHRQDTIAECWRLESFWILAYPPRTPNLRNIRPNVTKIDWSFIIGYVLSLIALLFTFDAISGERERGTLRLMLANSIPRHIALMGKFLGALISISVPFTLAVLINLLIISTAKDVHLGVEAWGRLSILFFIALLYTCLFLALGLLVSARVQRSAVSLVILLLIWVVFVIFVPSTLASIASDFSPPMSPDEFKNAPQNLTMDLMNFGMNTILCGRIRLRF